MFIFVLLHQNVGCWHLLAHCPLCKQRQDNRSPFEEEARQLLNMKPQLESSPHLTNRINSVRLMEGGDLLEHLVTWATPALEILPSSHFPHLSSVVTFFRFPIPHVTFLDTATSPHVTPLLPPFPLLGQTGLGTKEKLSSLKYLFRDTFGVDTNCP